MELELVEPSLYLRMDPDAPARFADALVRRAAERDDSTTGHHHHSRVRAP
jgi:hypothetical protein